MKFLALVLAIYFFALNFYPCSDAHGCDEDIEVEISFDHDIEHDHCDSELCSPFCYCHCCQIHTSSIVLQNYSLTNFSYFKSIFGHFERTHEGAIFKLLQPPQYMG